MNLKLHIASKTIFTFKDNNIDIKVYGNIYNKEYIEKLIHFDDNFNLQEYVSNISGYFFIYIKFKNTEYLINDIFGNFRVYYYIQNDTIYLYDLLSDVFKNYNGKLVINKYEQKYFLRHNYTTGANTIYKNLKKLLPASIWEINNKVIKENIYFNSANYLLNNKQYKQSNYEFIKDNIIKNIDINAHNILMFSGGVDSTYLYLILEELEIDVELCFIQYSIYDRDNIIDLNKVQKIAKHFNKKVTILECDVESLQKKYQDIATSLHLFDKSFFAMYYAMDELRKRYGKCNIINGQSSDSIYCWGNSSKTFGAFLQRFLVNPIFYKSPVWIKKISAKIIEKTYKIKWRSNLNFVLPYNGKEYYTGLLDPQGYVPVIIDDKSYIKYLEEISENIIKKIKNKKDIIYYMKLMYLQGTSNIMVIKSAEKYEHNLLMPFVDARVFYNRLINQNDVKDLLFPRYVLEELMTEKYNFDLIIIDNAKKLSIKKNQIAKVQEFNSFIKKIFLEWDQSIENLSK